MTIEMKKISSILNKILRFLIQAFIPILLILGCVRLILVSAPLWIPIEYRLPGFPDDLYGFSLEDRLKWSDIDIQYLLNQEGIDYFDSLQLNSGDPMHNERELRHMQDVKLLVQQSWLTFRIGLVVLIFLGILLARAEGQLVVWETIRRGFLWTLILLGILVVGIVIAFGFLFVGFHKIFFEGETWIFKYSDTFIRLYPERFWRDVFIFLATTTGVGAGLLFYLTGKILPLLKAKEVPSG